MDFTSKPKTAISVCTGIRGIERGLKRAGVNLREIAMVEIEAFACENLVCQMEAGLLDPAPIWTNARTFDGEPFRGLVDILLGGYPCQGESLAGLRELENYAGYLWPSIRKIVKSTNVPVCFFENVDDHLTGTFKYVLNDLRSMGYLVEAGVYSAEEVGAPHERQRIFILAIHHSYRERFRQEYQVSAGRDRPEHAGKAMEDSFSNRNGGRNGLGEDRGYSLQTQGPNSLAYCPVQGLPQFSFVRQQPEDSGPQRSGELAHPRRERRRSNNGRIQKEPSQDEGTPQGPDRERSGDELENSGEGVPNTIIEGQQTGNFHDADSPRSQAYAGPVCQPVAYPNVCRTQSGEPAGVGRVEELDEDLWPAGPGPQFDWEHPRTLTRAAESEVGLTIAGYNFREDILRAAGNSVVEHQSEFAWVDLIRKHYGA